MQALPRGVCLGPQRRQLSITLTQLQLQVLQLGSAGGQRLLQALQLPSPTAMAEGGKGSI